MVGQLALQGDREVQRIGRWGERQHETVTGVFHLSTAVTIEERADEAVVISDDLECRLVTKRIEESGGPDHIGEGEGAGGGLEPTVLGIAESPQYCCHFGGIHGDNLVGQLAMGDAVNLVHRLWIGGLD